MEIILVVQIVQEGVGMLELIQNIPKELSRYVLQSSSPLGLVGKGFKALLQKFVGNGFVVWINRYFVNAETIIHATGLDPAFDLCIAVRNKVRAWNDVLKIELPALHFQFVFVATGNLHAHFDAGMEYETFDIQFDPVYLRAWRTDYGLFEQFMNEAKKKKAVNLPLSPMRCSSLMLEAVQGIIYNNYGIAGKMRLLQNNIGNILTAALEDIARSNMKIQDLTDTQVSALYEVKRLIDESIPYYPGNKQLCRKTFLNHFTFNYGFKRLFGVSPYRYYNTLRMERGKDLLRQGEAVHSVAAELDFETPRAFGKAFKAMFGLTPKEYRGELP